MTVSIPKRSLNFEIEGKVYPAKELSLAYLMGAIQNPDDDTVDNALKDSMGELTDEDFIHFGIDTKEKIYTELVKFTYKEAITKEQKQLISSETGMTPEEISAMTKDAQVQLKNVIEGRQPEDPSKKKPS